MANTTNFNWETPDDTDLVKDGAAAIRTLGNSIDTSLVDLKGGTTGQILSKASNTDLDYTWIANDQGDITEVSAGTGISVASGTGPVPVVTNTVATTFDAKGDLVVGTGADTFAKLAVGTNGYTLVADSVETTGLKWVAAAAGGKVLQVVAATSSFYSSIKSASPTDVSNMSVSITPSSATSKVLICGMMNGNTSQTATNQRCLISLVNGSNTELYAIYGADVQIEKPSMNMPFVYLHSPASTSSLTYKLRVMNDTSAQGVYLGNFSSGTAITNSIVAMEIGA